MVQIIHKTLVLIKNNLNYRLFMRFSNSFLGSITDFRFFKLLSFLIIYNDKKYKNPSLKKKK